MTSIGRPIRARGATINFTETRAASDRADAARRHQAARTVAEHSLDASDCRELLSMLGLSGREPDAAPPRTPEPAQGRHPNHSHLDAPAHSGQPKEHTHDARNHQVVQW